MKLSVLLYNGAIFFGTDIVEVYDLKITEVFFAHV
jgi:hypothetical protein